MYTTGHTIEDKDAADRVFLNNMLRIIRAHTKSRWLRYLRAKRAKIYYHAVCLFGGPYFWDDKNRHEEQGLA